MIRGILRYDAKASHVIGFSREGRRCDFVSTLVCIKEGGKNRYYDACIDPSDWDAVALEWKEKFPNEIDKTVIVEAARKTNYKKPFPYMRGTVVGKLSLVSPAELLDVAMDFGREYTRESFELYIEEGLNEDSSCCAFPFVRHLSEEVPRGGTPLREGVVFKDDLEFDPEDDDLFEEGWINGHDVWRDPDDGGVWYDGYYCADASDYEEAEMEYWNTH